MFFLQSREIPTFNLAWIYHIDKRERILVPDTNIQREGVEACDADFRGKACFEGLGK